jgi:hypothetical protein
MIVFQSSCKQTGMGSATVPVAASRARVRRLAECFLVYVVVVRASPCRNLPVSQWQEIRVYPCPSVGEKKVEIAKRTHFPIQPAINQKDVRSNNLRIKVNQGLPRSTSAIQTYSRPLGGANWHHLNLF